MFSVMHQLALHSNDPDDGEGARFKAVKHGGGDIAILSELIR